jgi:ferrous iron transport protein B
VGHYGILTLGLFNAVVTVLPILTVFFLMFGFLEDIGYMPNLCVLVKRVFEKIGLTGKAIMPLVLALGCKTMATLVTKSLRSRKEKFIAVYLIAFAIPCAAQLAIDMGIIGRLGDLRLLGFLIAYGTLAIVEISVGFLLNKTIKDDEKSDFLQELPAIRVPNPKAIIDYTGSSKKRFQSLL